MFLGTKSTGKLLLFVLHFSLLVCVHGKRSVTGSAGLVFYETIYFDQ